jgi:hypothetical protein
MTILSRVSALVISTLALFTNAQQTLPGKVVNGCGPSLIGFLIPDNIGSCKLESACNKHDLCYGACLPGGTLDGTGVCDTGEIARQQRKRACDTHFYDDIVQTNGGACGGWASLYQKFVGGLGGGFFNGMELPQFERIISTSRTPAEVETKLLYIKELAKTQLVDLSKIEVQADGSIQIPTLRSLPNLDTFKQGTVTIPKSVRLDAQQLKKLRRELDVAAKQ